MEEELGKRKGVWEREWISCDRKCVCVCVRVCAQKEN
jgi:hypothetical protein